MGTTKYLQLILLLSLFLGISIYVTIFASYEFDIYFGSSSLKDKQQPPSQQQQSWPNPMTAQEARAIGISEAFIDPSSVNKTLPNNPIKIYFCGYPGVLIMYKHIFPEHTGIFDAAEIFSVARHSDQLKEQDIVINAFGGRCGYNSYRPKVGDEWFHENANVTYIEFNGESIGGESHSYVNGTLPLPKSYRFGYVPDGCQSLRVYELAQFFLRTPQYWDQLIHPERYPPPVHRPYDNETRGFLVYLHKNCVPLREKAFQMISMANVGNVHCHVCCGGLSDNVTNLVKVSNAQGSSLVDNQIFTYFRFFLVMENTEKDGYITEKILNAFMAGCIPIYHGTREIFDIFNPRSFIYWNIKDPQSTIDEIINLEHDKDAYFQMVSQPILKDGNRTIQKYFSLSDDIIPNAELKRRIRAAMMTHC